MRTFGTIHFAAVLAVMFATAPLLANAESKLGSSETWMKLSINGPLSLFGALLGKAEFKVSDRISLLAHLGYIDHRMSVAQTIHQNPVPWATGRTGIGARFYFRGNNMSDFYFDGNVETDVGRTFSGMEEISPGFGRIGPFFWALKTMCNFGYSWVTNFGLFVEIDAGIELAVLFFGAPDYKPELADSLYKWTRLNIGWAF